MPEEERSEIEHLDPSTIVFDMGERAELDHYYLNTLKEYVETELELAGFGKNLDENSKKGKIRDFLSKTVDLFLSQEHTFESRDECIYLLRRLLMRLPISPLTGEEEEWINHSTEGFLTNKRCRTILKHINTGEVVHCQAVVFRKNNGAFFTTDNSFRKVKFPYYPVVAYVELDEKNNVIKEHYD